MESDKLRFNRKDGQHSFHPKNCLIRAYYRDHAIEMARRRRLPLPVICHIMTSEGRGAKYGLNPVEVKRVIRSLKKSTDKRVIPSYLRPFTRKYINKIDDRLFELKEWLTSGKPYKKMTGKPIVTHHPAYWDKPYSDEKLIKTEISGLEYWKREGCHEGDYDENRENWETDLFNFCRMELVKWNTANNKVDGEVVEGLFIMKPEGSFYKVAVRLKSPLSDEDYKRLTYSHQMEWSVEQFRANYNHVGSGGNCFGGEYQQIEPCTILEAEKEISKKLKVTTNDIHKIIESHEQEQFCLVKTVMDCSKFEAEKLIGVRRASELRY